MAALATVLVSPAVLLPTGEHFHIVTALPVLFFAFAVPATKWWRNDAEPVGEVASVEDAESV